jgi:hypothetical protein
MKKYWPYYYDANDSIEFPVNENYLKGERERRFESV